MYRSLPERLSLPVRVSTRRRERARYPSARRSGTRRNRRPASSRNRYRGAAAAFEAGDVLRCRDEHERRRLLPRGPSAVLRPALERARAPDDLLVRLVRDAERDPVIAEER